MNANIIKFNYPAEDSITGWEKNSLCVGNGFLGANIFSDTEKECITISEHTLSMPPAHYYGLVPKCGTLAKFLNPGFNKMMRCRVDCLIKIAIFVCYLWMYQI